MRWYFDPGLPSFYYDTDDGLLHGPGLGGNTRPTYEEKAVDFTAADLGAYIVKTNNVVVSFPSAAVQSDAFDLIVGYGTTGVTIHIPLTAVSGNTFDPGKTSTAINLSNGDLTATGNIVAGLSHASLCTIGINDGDGKFQAEFSVNAGANCVLGVSTDAGALTYQRYIGQNGAAAESVGYWGSGTVFYDLAGGSGSDTGLATYISTDIIGVLLDASSSPPTVHLQKNGTTIDSKVLTAGQTWYVAASVFDTASVTLATALTYPEAGYLPFGTYTPDTLLNGLASDETFDGPLQVSFTYVDTTTGWISNPQL